LAEDLGTWPPEQATVLVEVLQKAGITPQAKRTREGIEVTVEDGDSDQAHATLVANMDAIARAARSPGPEAGRRRTRTPAARQEPRGRDGGERQLTSQRMSRFARPVAMLIAALMLAAAPIPFPLRLLILAAAVLAIVWMLGREPDEDTDSR
jgi:hypothetical protein